MIIMALEGLNEEFDNIIEEATFLWKNGTESQFLNINISYYMSFTNDDYCSINSIIFYSLKMLISLNVACIVILAKL